MTNNDSPIMFKSAVGGFDKKAVMAYIFELNETAQAAQKKLKEELEEVTQAREALDQQLNEANKKMQRMQAEVTNLNNQLNSERERNNSMTEEIAKLTTEMEQKKQQLAKKEEELLTNVNFKRRAAELELSVNRYNAEIDRLQQTIAQQREQLEAAGDSGSTERVAELEAELAALQENQDSEAQERIAALEEALRERDSQLAAVQGQASQEEASQQIADLRETVEGLNNEIRRQREIINLHDAQEQTAEALCAEYQAKLQSVEEKQKEVDRSSAQVGRLLLDATSDAEKMRTDAREEGDRIVFRANSEAEKIITDAKMAAKIAEEDGQRALADLQRQFAAFCNDISSLQEKILAAAADMQAKSQSVNTILEMAGHSMHPGDKANEVVSFRSATDR